MAIRVLERDIVSRIAAGEVVERPASVVKELVENSLDAGSSQISVEIRGGGMGLIRVTDSGSGIPSDEVELAFERHATSKIRGLPDLESINSLGFRGEALPSIAAVADMEMVTGTAGEPTGTCLSLRDGVVVGRGSQGCPPGTTVTVRNLFRRVPARLKFLKSVATESSHLADVVSQYALAFPEVRFTLSSDGRGTLRTPGSGRLMDSIIAVYGLEIARHMLEIKEAEWEGGAPASTRVTGMVGSPKISRASRNYLSFFVNRRWVSSRLLAWAVEEAYHGFLMTGKHPVAVINIFLPPSEVDVNIHPAKTEVKFQHEHLVFSAIQKAVRRALIELAPVPSIEEVATAYAPPKAVPAWSAPARNEDQVQNEDRPALPLMNLPTPTASLPVLRVLGQLANSYIVAEGDDGLYLIDQHAAHERILFEKMKQQQARHQPEVQGLLAPVTLEVSARQGEMLKSTDDELAGFGFSIEPFGDRTYLVRTVPALLHSQDWMGALTDLLDSLAAAEKEDRTENIAISLACHGAVRAGKTLTDSEMRELIRQLEQTEAPRTCPHGRPTVVHLSSGQLVREFRRT
jgi:DNA mismatch repair protein MutL